MQLVGSRLAVTSTYSGQYNVTGQYVSSEGYLFRNLIVNFPTPVTAFGFHMGLTSQPWDLQAYDADGNVVETVTVPARISRCPRCERGPRRASAGTVANDGPERATSAVLSIDLAGLVPADDGVVSAPRGCVVSGTTVTCALGDLRPGARVRRTIRVVPDAPGAIVLTASASSAVPDPNAQNSVAVVTESVP